MQLVRITVRASSPVKRQGCENSGHGVVGVPSHSPFGTQCEQDMRTKLANVQCEFVNNSVQFLPIELSVRIVEDDWLGDLQNLARCRKFLPAKLGEFMVGLRSAPIRSRLTGGE